MKKILAAFLLTLPTMAVAVDLEGYYITPKVGVSKSMDTGTTSFTASSGPLRLQSNEDLGTGTAFGLSAGKYLTDNFRLEMEAIKRTGYNYDTRRIDAPIRTSKADIETQTLFINGFYDFHPFTISNTPITPYLGGGIGVSRNKMGTAVRADDAGAPSRRIDGTSINEFAYKLSAGTLFSLTENVSLDVNYQYVNLGAFKSGTRNVRVSDGVVDGPLLKGYSGGDIKSQELMVGLQYTF
jgi:opacity protein-like surface antigen